MENKKNKLINSYLGQLKSKAFTLIELLAIIVILAIIAVITVPIILNVIDNAKRGSIIDSAYGYKDAIDKYYITKLMEEDFELDDTYSVSDGKLGGIDIPISGMKPISGTLTYEDNELKSGCLTFDDYSVTYDGSKFTNEKGICPTGRAITYTDSNGVKYYNTEWIGANPVYYNPVTGENCTDYNETNSKTGYNGVSPTDNQTSCLKWYAYSQNQDGTINMILDHNITTNLAWITSVEYRNAEQKSLDVGVSYPDGMGTYEDAQEKTVNNRGPLLLLTQLKLDTNNWNGIEKFKDKDRYTAIYDNIRHYTIDYSNYNARLITAEEIATIIGKDDFSLSSNNLYFDTDINQSPDMQNEGKYSWLYDNTTSCDNTNCTGEGDTRGYWTASPRMNSSNNKSSFIIYYNGSLNGYSVTTYDKVGLRPVITVSKSSIFES